MKNNKIISLEAAAGLVENDSMLALGGMTIYRRPMAFIKALLRRRQQTGAPAGLTLLSFTAGLESDLLVGAGIARRVRTCYFGLEIFGLAPMFTYYANRGELEVVEETEASLAFGLRAQNAGVGFMAGRGWLGTDLPRLRPDVRTVTDPYSGEELMAFPAVRPDLAVIHALRADPFGNAQIGDNQGVDLDLILASRSVIITAEEITEDLPKADLVGHLVSAVVLAPGGAHPTSCHPLYPVDGEQLLAYTEQVGDPLTFAAFLDTYLAS